MYSYTHARKDLIYTVNIPTLFRNMWSFLGQTLSRSLSFTHTNTVCCFSTAVSALLETYEFKQNGLRERNKKRPETLRDENWNERKKKSKWFLLLLYWAIKYNFFLFLICARVGIYLFISLCCRSVVLLPVLSFHFVSRRYTVRLCALASHTLPSFIQRIYT